jgi:putative ABC transport system substrate-binding protein
MLSLSWGSRMQFDQLKRRKFITLLGGAVTWPCVARGQQPAMPVVGILFGGLSATFGPLLSAMRAGLNETGYVEGRNIAFETRFAEGDKSRLPALAADLVARNVDVIVANAPDATVAAKPATSTIPIVFVMGSDPVKLGLVASLNRPGGNVTGVNFFVYELEAKRLGILHELLPKAESIGVLLNPNSPEFENQSRDLNAAARTLRLNLHIERASNERDFDVAFAALVKRRVEALLVGADPYFFSARASIVAAAANFRIPAIYGFREYAVAGGLMSYGTRVADAERQGGIYVGRILKREKAADLPVLQSTRFELVVNLKSAQALGVEVPPQLSAQANEVID